MNEKNIILNLEHPVCCRKQDLTPVSFIETTVKKVIFLSIFLGFSTFLFSQDVIVTQKDERIEAKIITEYDAVIKYVLYSDPDGQTQLILKSKIKTITYENGKVECFDVPPVSKSANSNTIVDEKGKVVSNEKIRKNMIRINPLVPILGAWFGIFDIEFQYARYLTRKVAIALDVEIGAMSGVGTIGILMIGIEAVPATHRQKSGLLLCAFVGPYISAFDVDANNKIWHNEGVWLATKAGIGYQLVSKSGFTFNTSIGPRYNTFEQKVAFNFDLNLGFAF